MEREKLLRIIGFNNTNEKQIQSAVLKFYELLGREGVGPIPNIQRIASLLFEKTGYKLYRLPLKSCEIGAFQLQLNDSKYVVLNTAKSLANNNFALCHELYHTLIQEKTDNNTAEVYMERYDENQDEMMANAFAGAVLMPTGDFVMTNHLLSTITKRESAGLPEGIGDLIRVLALMDNYKTTYMSVVIQCYKENVFDINDVEKMCFLLKYNDEQKIRKLFRDMSKYIRVDGLMEPSYIDDFEVLYNDARTKGERSLQNGLITEADLKYRLEGLKRTHERVAEVRHDS